MLCSPDATALKPRAGRTVFPKAPRDADVSARVPGADTPGAAYQVEAAFATVRPRSPHTRFGSSQRFHGGPGTSVSNAVGPGAYNPVPPLPSSPAYSLRAR